VTILREQAINWFDETTWLEILELECVTGQNLNFTLDEGNFVVSLEDYYGKATKSQAAYDHLLGVLFEQMILFESEHLEKR
jgi:hypothetical protein